MPENSENVWYAPGAGVNARSFVYHSVFVKLSLSFVNRVYPWFLNVDLMFWVKLF